MDNLFDWLDRQPRELNIVPSRHIDCARCGEWVALVSYAGSDDSTGRARALAGLARASDLPSYLVTVANADDFTAVVHTLHPLDSEQLLTSDQFRTVITRLAERHTCPT